MDAALQLPQALAGFVEQLRVGDGDAALAGGAGNNRGEQAVEVDLRQWQGGGAGKRGDGGGAAGVARGCAPVRRNELVVGNLPGRGGDGERAQVRAIAGFVHADENSHPGSIAKRPAIVVSPDSLEGDRRNQKSSGFLELARFSMMKTRMLFRTRQVSLEVARFFGAGGLGLGAGLASPPLPDG